MKAKDAAPITPHEARRIAVLACVCERTVRRFLAGLPVRSTCRARIEQALAIQARGSGREFIVAGVDR